MQRCYWSFSVGLLSDVDSAVALFFFVAVRLEASLVIRFSCGLGYATRDVLSLEQAEGGE